MADVTGTIGNEHVELNNAATEATLKLLLQSNLTANKQSIENIKNLAEKSGIDPETLQATEQAFTETTKQTDLFKASIYEAGRVVGALSPALQKITQGTGQASDLLHGLANASGGLPVVGGVISTVISGFAMLAKVQEDYLIAFENISRSGANFDGSLTRMRLSAANAYLTVDQFSKAVKSNSEIFSTMGGDVQKGVDKFVRIQNTLLAPGSAVSKNLGYLGVNAEEAAELTASFIRSQGTMNKTSLQDTNKISAAVAQYAQELSVLSEITGKNREELQKKLDEENAEAQWQNFLATVSTDKAAKFRQGLEMALAQGGKPAIEAFKSLAMGFPPLTKGAQLYYATQQAGVASLQQYVKNANDAGTSVEQSARLNRQALAHSIASGSQDMDGMRSVLRVSGLASTELAGTLSDAQKLQNRYMKDGKMLSEAEIAADLERLATSKKSEDGSAAAAQQTQRQLQRLGQEILSALIPALEFFQQELNKNAGTIVGFVKDNLVPAIEIFSKGLVNVYEYFRDNSDKLKTWGTVIGGLIVSMIGLNAVVSALTITEKIKSAVGTAVYGVLGTRTRPMYVYVLNPGGAGLGGAGAPGAPEGEGKGGKGSRAGKYAIGAAGLGIAGSVAGATGGDKFGALANIGSDALAGAALGAAIPGLNATGVSEIVGGLLGAGVGLYNNWGTFFADSKKDLKAEREAKEKAEKNQQNQEDTTTPSVTGDPLEKLNSSIERLNNHMVDIKNYMLQTANNTRRTVTEIHQMHGDTFPRP